MVIVMVMVMAIVIIMTIVMVMGYSYNNGHSNDFYGCDYGLRPGDKLSLKNIRKPMKFN